MGNGQPASALRQLRALFVAGTATGLTDSELLERYTTKRAHSADATSAAETAFAALVDRHGPMVWGICQPRARRRPRGGGRFSGDVSHSRP